MWPRRVQNMSCVPWYPRCGEWCLLEVEKGSGPEGQSLIPKCLLDPRCCVFLALKNSPVNFSVKMMPAGDVWCFLLHFPFC